MIVASILHSPPSGKEGWLKAGVVGGYTMLIITDLRIHYHLPLRGLLLPEGGEWRILSTINYQIIIFLINFTTKFEEEPHGIKIIPTKKYFSGTN